jgi:hypothetical protein
MSRKVLVDVYGVAGDQAVCICYDLKADMFLVPLTALPPEVRTLLEGRANRFRRLEDEPLILGAEVGPDGGLTGWAETEVEPAGV